MTDNSLLTCSQASPGRNTVPANIWNAARVVAEALSRKNMNKRHGSAGKRAGKAATSTMHKGSCDYGQ